MTMVVLRSTGHVFCRMPFSSLIFLMLELGFREEDHRRKILFSSKMDSSQRWILSICLVPVDAGRDHVAEVVSVRSCTWHWPPSLSILSSLEGRHYALLTLKEWGTEYLCKLFIILHGRFVFSLIYIFIQSFICVCMDTWILYLILWVILSYLFVYILLLKFFCL